MPYVPSVTIKLSEEARNLIGRLVATGLYSASIEACATELLLAALRREMCPTCGILGVK